MTGAPAALVLLFIGNSLSAANDLPAMLEAMGKASGVPIRCAIVAKPNFSLDGGPLTTGCLSRTLTTSADVNHRATPKHHWLCVPSAPCAALW